MRTSAAHGNNHKWVRFVIFYFLHNRSCIVFDFRVQVHLHWGAFGYFAWILVRMCGPDPSTPLRMTWGHLPPTERSGDIFQILLYTES